MSKDSKSQSWPPVPGDFEVGNPEKSVAVCTLGKKIKVDADYCIIGTCKTENIGIERVVVNVISNPNIRCLILCGPEVPGHHTGSSLRSLYHDGVDETNRKILGAKGAIPYIENIPLEAVERFREQVSLVDLMNESDPKKITAAVTKAEGENPGPFADGPMWVDFGTGKKSSTVTILSGAVSLIPEYNFSFNPATGLVDEISSHAKVALHPSTIIVDMKNNENGTILVGKEI
ncbi:tetrahydromethanopterin S-methyltransferase subunit A [Candidatus Thorarchaeota archaeon]|nr:MAG: tetrahydromethanopterin S-methyltransferase subunit A [Candidatus Thorarchaeota archaeon]